MPRASNVNPVVNDHDGAILLVAAIIQQLKKDKRTHTECETLDGHSVMLCSQLYLASIDEFLDQEPPPDVVEITMEVLRLHTWPREE